MLSFYAEFPIEISRSKSDFMQIVKRWIIDSPHTFFVERDIDELLETEKFEIENDIQRIEILSVETDVLQHVAVKNIFHDDSFVWTTSVVFFNNSLDAYVGVRTYCEAKNPKSAIPSARKPVIVQSLLYNLHGGVDGEFRVGDLPHSLDDDEISLASSLIVGKTDTKLPIVYMSRDFTERFIVDPNSLARKLSGMAHVLLEPNRAFSRRLQIESGGRNVYGGVVGLYWPDGTGHRAFHFGREFQRVAQIRDGIYDEVRAALVNKRPIYHCTWPSVQELWSRRIINDLKSKESNEVEMYIANFDAELSAKDEKIAGAEKEIDRLKREVKSIGSKRAAGLNLDLKITKEQDLFDGEIREFVVQALRDALSRSVSKSRFSHVLDDLLHSNPIESELEGKRDIIKSALRNYVSLDKKTEDVLRNLGFSIQEDGKHYKLVYQNDGRYTFALSKTSSDHRAGLNMASDISKTVFL